MRRERDAQDDAVFGRFRRDGRDDARLSLEETAEEVLLRELLHFGHRDADRQAEVKPTRWGNSDGSHDGDAAARIELAPYGRLAKHCQPPFRCARTPDSA